MRWAWLAAFAVLGVLAVMLPLGLRQMDLASDQGAQFSVAAALGAQSEQGGRLALLEARLDQAIAAQAQRADRLEQELVALKEQRAPAGPGSPISVDGVDLPPAPMDLPPVPKAPSISVDLPPAPKDLKGTRSILEVAAKVEKGDYYKLNDTKITTCSVRAAARPVWGPAQPIQEPEMQPWPADARGAIATSWSGPDREQWICQWRTLQEYCAMHGYTLYPINDTEEWQAERLRSDLSAHWLKIQVLRKLLLKHPWVLHMDVDAMFPDVASSRSVEDAMGSALSTKSLIVTERRQWNTDTVFIRSSAWGRRFVENVWELRHVCPHCIGEQCALALEVLNNVIGHHLDMGNADSRTIGPYEGWSCCLPRALCEWPLSRKSGPRFPAGGRGNRNVFYCTGAWMTEYFNKGGGPANRKDPQLEPAPKNDHPHILFWEQFRRSLGIRHPSKTRTSCECFKVRVHNETAEQAYKSCRDWKR
ncbi:unnamed protein product [Prorocentrum cordatum]|uniref:Nucleotide-diphospho-sugar transferase domain-containing protein n=1 Tax=Prorocentrum cordatum TaxID=2364126 RepID=A0ABN9W8N1_9DINO|nr:unnamed protein product [Polarella glacialis]